MHDVRVHLCNRDLGRRAQYVKTVSQRSSVLGPIHICIHAKASPRVALALQDGISFAIGRMGCPVLSPVVWMAGTPACLRAVLVFAIIGVGAHVLLLPPPASLSLTGRRRAKALVWDVRQGTKYAATGEAPAGVIHHALHTLIVIWSTLPKLNTRSAEDAEIRRVTPRTHPRHSFRWAVFMKVLTKR
jgi:hypothetical protein